ncbi:helix-turn-helix domain-containing protein [Paraburkholderia sabiae]|uniref:Helix-turn-helix domain-containing protein n=1 Tax=Paraburkholderia sabiae TaxID=273251 RepID=A0ABU9QKB0_9BURK|nr:helix-turn-helix domain-containing protein [Paraburkholderia sabiae]WJZ76474.1 helix-turn-helix domain-containing protein [Paraburkholderia sabiae]CAD6560164.1 Transcriptional activator NphR [Paraburkholderia sabiae]
MNASKFSLNEVAELQRMAYWQDAIYKNYLTVDCRRLDHRSLAGNIRASRVGGLDLSEVTSPPMSYHRGPNQIAAGNERHFLLVLAVEGQGIVKQRGNRTLFGPGDMVIYGSQEASEISYPNGSTTQVIRIPSSLLEDRTSSTDRIAANLLDGSSPGGAIARALIRECIAANLGDHVADSRLANGVLEILTAVIENSLPTASLSRGAVPLSQVKKYVEEHLLDPDLSVQQIAVHNSVSVRTLNRMFAAEGTTAVNWIWTRRLANSYRLLSEGKVRQVSQAAFDSGFNDLSHFGRAFKKRYGRLPHEVLRNAN